MAETEAVIQGDARPHPAAAQEQALLLAQRQVDEGGRQAQARWAAQSTCQGRREVDCRRGSASSAHTIRVTASTTLYPARSVFVLRWSLR